LGVRVDFDFEFAIANFPLNAFFLTKFGLNQSHSFKENHAKIGQRNSPSPQLFYPKMTQGKQSFTPNPLKIYPPKGIFYKKSHQNFFPLRKPFYVYIVLIC
jgi:hypothetical protein